MTFDKFTIKAQEVVQQAVNTAQQNGQQTIEPVHILKGILLKGRDVANFIFQKLGVNAQQIETLADQEIQHLPRVQGGQPYLSTDANNVLAKSQSLAKQMGVPEVAASTLYDRQFYAKIRNRFINTYFSISKLNKLNTHFMESIKTPKDAVDGFLGLMLAKAGGMQEIDAYLEELKANQVFADRINYKRTKDALLKAASKAKLSSKDELVAELDDCFINLKANGG